MAGVIGFGSDGTEELEEREDKRTGPLEVTPVEQSARLPDERGSAWTVENGEVMGGRPLVGCGGADGAAGWCACGVARSILRRIRLLLASWIHVCLLGN